MKNYSEHDIQSLIRLQFSKDYKGALFRVNVGQAWTGDAYKKNLDGSITITNPRPLATGLPKGFSDLFGVLEGGKAVFLEVKSAKGRATTDQLNFIEQMQNLGAIAGIARNLEDLKRLLGD